MSRVISLLTLEHKIGSDSLGITVNNIFEKIGAGEKAIAVTAKYGDVLVELSNDLLVVLKDGAAEYRKKEEE